MDGTSKKKGTSGKEKDRVPVVVKELIEKFKQNNVQEYVIPLVLNQKPKPGLAWSTYLMDKESISANSNEKMEDVVKVYLGFPNYDKTGQLQKLYIKNSRFSINFLSTVFSVLPKYEYVSSLKLFNCNLSKHAIEILHLNLAEMPNVVDLALDDNPINAQNHGLIISNDTIKFFSLKRCKLSKIGIDYIYENLAKKQQSKLQILNLAGNYIDDAAAVGIEKILRENRSITTLILADNWITDVGCCGIISALQSFTLTSDEIVKRRSMTINYIRKKIKMAEEYKKDKIHIKLPPTPPPSSKSKKLGKSKKKDMGRKSLFHNEVNKQVSEYVDNILPKITHPFICETQRINGTLRCTGNLILGFLNLAYNKITLKTYKLLVNVLDYQFSKEQTAHGLTYIVLNGNSDLQSIEFDEVTRIIIEKLWRVETRHRSKASTDIDELNLSTATSFV